MLICCGCNGRSTGGASKPVEIRRYWGKAGTAPPTPAWDWLLLPTEDYTKR